MADTLPTEEWGAGPTVGLIHGFTQSAASWAPVAGRLAHRWHLVAVDAPGHGRAPAVRADLWEAAALAGATVGPAAWVGYSMGGRMALHLALARPDLVRALVLVSATAGIDDAAERARRREADDALASRIQADGVEAFVRWWLARPLFASLRAEDAALESRLGGDPDGWASSLRLAGTGTQDPLWDRLGQLAMPVLVVAGALDTAFCERARRLAEGIGANATLAVLPDVGHSCHLEAPGPFSELIDGWLSGPGGHPGP